MEGVGNVKGTFARNMKLRRSIHPTLQKSTSFPTFTHLCSNNMIVTSFFQSPFLPPQRTALKKLFHPLLTHFPK